MIYAPVMIPTLCRSEHFIRCVESLKRNSWAEYTDMYIALDYPAKDEHWNGYREICSYLEKSDFTMFAFFHVIKRETNYGSGKNSREMREYLFQRYDCVIRTDDDVEFSPNFLEYMDKALERYRDDDKVIAVSGYSYPVEWDVSQGSNTMLENIVAPMWGTGFWREKYEMVDDYIRSGGLIHDFARACQMGKYKEMTSAAWIDYAVSATGRHPYESLVCSMSDIALRIYLGVKDCYVIAPTISKSRNWGFDGSGVFCPRISESRKGKCSRDYLYKEQPIDEKNDFEIVPDVKQNFKENRNRLNSFDRRSFGEIAKASFRAAVYMALGEKRYRKLTAFVRGGYRSDKGTVNNFLVHAVRYCRIGGAA